MVNPDKIFGAAWTPLVSLAVAIILFDGGLDLVTKGLAGEFARTFPFDADPGRSSSQDGHDRMARVGGR